MKWSSRLRLVVGETTVNIGRILVQLHGAVNRIVRAASAPGLFVGRKPHSAMTQRFVHCIEFRTLLRPTIGRGAAGFNGLHEVLIQLWGAPAPGIRRPAFHDCLEMRISGFHLERI